MIEYRPTENRDFSEDSDFPQYEEDYAPQVLQQEALTIVGYQPKFRPTSTVSKPVFQKEPQGGELDFNSTTNLGMRYTASKYLQQKLGLTKEQAAGLIGVWQAESLFNVNAENKEEKSGKNKSVKSNQYGIGIGQWTGSRHDDFTKYVNEHGGKADLKTQLDFAIDEIQTKYKDFLNNLRTAKTVKDATAYTYAQYTAANEKHIKGLDDLYARVSKIESRYAKKHKEMYGKAGSGAFNKRVRFAQESIFAKKGAKLPKMGNGDLILWYPDVSRGAPVSGETIADRQAFMESSYTNAKKNRTGAQGLYQIRDIALKQFQKDNPRESVDLSDVSDNAKVRDYLLARDLNAKVFTKDSPTDSVRWAKALAAYDYGRGNTLRVLGEAKNKGYDVTKSMDWVELLPKETKGYVNYILRGKDINKYKNAEKQADARQNASSEILDAVKASGKVELPPDPALVRMRGQIEWDPYVGPDHYDYRFGRYDSETDNWSFSDSKTGLILKSPEHPDFNLELKAARDEGKLLYYYPKENRYYILDPNEPIMPGMVETSYSKFIK